MNVTIPSKLAFIIVACNGFKGHKKVRAEVLRVQNSSRLAVTFITKFKQEKQ